jgi:hypothetical protein
MAFLCSLMTDVSVFRSSVLDVIATCNDEHL